MSMRIIAGLEDFAGSSAVGSHVLQREPHEFVLNGVEIDAFSSTEGPDDEGSHAVAALSADKPRCSSLICLPALRPIWTRLSIWSTACIATASTIHFREW